MSDQEKEEWMDFIHKVICAYRHHSYWTAVEMLERKYAELSGINIKPSDEKQIKE